MGATFGLYFLSLLKVDVGRTCTKKVVSFHLAMQLFPPKTALPMHIKYLK